VLRNVIGAVQQIAKVGSPEARVISEIAAHLDEDIMGINKLRQFVREIWKNHPKALRLILEHRPRLQDILETYQDRVRADLGQKLGFDVYPSKGELREIKLWLDDWWERGFPFVFMLVASDDGRAKVRVLVWQDDFRKHEAIQREPLQNAFLPSSNSFDRLLIN
jgi:hypothetical protein